MIKSNDSSIYFKEKKETGIKLVKNMWNFKITQSCPLLFF